jgi:hypothetical protein
MIGVANTVQLIDLFLQCHLADNITRRRRRLVPGRACCREKSCGYKTNKKPQGGLHEILHQKMRPRLDRKEAEDPADQRATAQYATNKAKL